LSKTHKDLNSKKALSENPHKFGPTKDSKKKPSQRWIQLGLLGNKAPEI